MPVELIERPVRSVDLSMYAAQETSLNSASSVPA
jgi:hypothetical protein